MPTGVITVLTTKTSYIWVSQLPNFQLCFPAFRFRTNLFLVKEFLFKVQNQEGNLLPVGGNGVIVNWKFIKKRLLANCHLNSDSHYFIYKSCKLICVLRVICSLPKKSALDYRWRLWAHACRRGQISHSITSASFSHWRESYPCIPLVRFQGVWAPHGLRFGLERHEKGIEADSHRRWYLIAKFYTILLPCEFMVRSWHVFKYHLWDLCLQNHNYIHD